MTSQEAFKDLLETADVPSNLKAQWSYRFERNKLSSDKIHEALIEYGYNVKQCSEWLSPFDQQKREICDSMIQLLLTNSIPSNKKKLWKNRLINNQLSLGKIEKVLMDSGYKMTQGTVWEKHLEFNSDERIQPNGTEIVVSNEFDSVWLRDGIIHNLLKGESYHDNNCRAEARETLFEKLSLTKRHPLIVDTSNLASQEGVAIRYYSDIKRRERFNCLAILASSAKSIYYGNFFKEIITLNIPCKVFHDYDKAIKWCKKFIIEPPEGSEVLEFENFDFWMDKDTMYHTFKSKTYSLKSAKKDLESFSDFRNDVQMSLVIDWRSIEKMPKNVQTFYLENPEILNGYKAFAIICDHPMNEKVAQFYVDHPAFTVPTKIFRYISEAKKWLKMFD